MLAERRRELAIEELVLRRWLRQYDRLRWLTLGVMTLASALVQVALGINVLVPVLLVAAGSAGFGLATRQWQRRRVDRWTREGDIVRLRQRIALIEIGADLVALTLALHYVGGVETPLFLFYFIPVGFASVILSRARAFGAMGLAIGLFVAMAGLELAGWLPHVQLAGFIPPGLYENPAFVAVLGTAFIVGLVICVVALTGIVRLLREQRLQRAQARGQQLEDLDRMRAFFLGLASHDLKTPLAVVSNYLQTILDGFVGEVNQKQRRWMERANVRVLAMIRLIDDFVDVSQLAPDRILGEMRRTAICDTVDRSVGEIRHQVDEKEVSLQIEIPAELPAVQASPRRLQRVLTNLLSNAVTCSPRSGEVSITVCQLVETVRFEITDAGPGIPRRYLADVFEDYLQVQRAEFVPGASLGLSTARKIVEAHGGTIWVESPCFDDGRGCRFAFTLPCRGQAGGGPRE